MSTNNIYRDRDRKALCGICPAGCWIIVSYDSEGMIRSVRPDESSPFGVLCKLGQHSREIVYSKDRLRYPMRRKGPKGTHSFERISWDDAYDIIVERLNRIKDESGPEATAIYTGRGSFELAMCDIYQPKDVAVSSASSVLFPFGSPNTLGVGALCYVSFAMIAPHVTMGGMLINMFSDIEHAGLVVVWGANPATDCPPLDLDRIVKARDRGAELIVIDPRRTMVAKLPGAHWIPLRPGTDGALALGMCHIIIHEELYDESFVREWTTGFEEFARYVQHFRPEVVAHITGVSAESIITLSRKIAGADGASPVMYSGLEYSDSGVQAIRATQVLWALAGQLDVPGGRCFSMKENQFPVNREGHVANPDLNKALGRDRFPVYSAYRGESHAMALPEAVIHGKPYHIRSLIVLGGSIITAWPQPAVWRETFHHLDFLVCIDRQHTADSAYADVVLPATTMYEIQSYMTYGPIFRIRERVIDPVGESRNDFFILAELAQRLGYGHLYPQNEKELLDHVLKGSGFTADEVMKSEGMVRVPSKIMEYKKWEKGLLRKDGKPGFDTPSGKFEIASSILEEHGYDSLPVYTEPKEGPLSNPDLAEHYPLVFNSGSRVTTDFRSQHHGIEGLCKERPEPMVTVNSHDARNRHIDDGDLVKIKTVRGQVVMRAYVTDDIVQGAIDANMGGGGPVGPDEWKQCNVNDVTDLERFDPVSGFPVYKALLCEVERVLQGEGTLNVNSGEYEVSTVAGHKNPEKGKIERVYLDHNATTPLAREVKGIMKEQMTASYGNPSSIYEEGKMARQVIDSARRRVARLINSTARRVLFTGGGSESNNLALKGMTLLKGNKSHIITTAIEHPSVLSVCKWLESRGMSVTYLAVGPSGSVDPGDLASAMTDRTGLVSIMMANNETGVIQPVEAIAIICRERNVLFHTDATQAVGKIPIDVDEMQVDMLTMSGHKIYGPKGVGVLYCRKGVVPEPIIHGGSQEHGLRAGTENVIAIAGLGKAAELAHENLMGMDSIRSLRDNLERGIRKLVPGARLNGHQSNRLPNTLNMFLPGLRGESVVLAMDQRGIAFSSGSACRSGSPEPSHALLAMGLTEEEAHCSVRLSLGLYNNKHDIERTLTALEQVIHDTANTARFVPCR